MENKLFHLAVEIAANAHKGQKDKGGNPYIQHPLKVAEGLKEPGLKIVAVLHDVLEDSDMTAEELLEMGFASDLVEAIRVLTHKKGDPDSYEEYIRKVKKNPIARLVKIEDIKHNLDLSRIPNPGQRDFRRCEKYKKALKYLQDV